MNIFSNKLFLTSLGLLVFMPLIANAAISNSCQEELLLTNNTDISLSNIEYSGMTPASGFYFLDKVGDWTKLHLFSVTTDAKLNTLLDQAEEKIGELELLQKQNNLKSRYLDILTTAYTDIMSQVDSKLAELQNKNVDMTAVMTRITQLNMRNKAILSRVLSASTSEQQSKLNLAYQQTADSFCTSINTWQERTSQCHDDIVVQQTLNSSFNNISNTISQAEQAVKNLQPTIDIIKDRTQILDKFIQSVDAGFLDLQLLLQEKSDDREARLQKFMQYVSDWLNSEQYQLLHKDIERMNNFAFLVGGSQQQQTLMQNWREHDISLTRLLSRLDSLRNISINDEAAVIGNSLYALQLKAYDDELLALAAYIAEDKIAVEELNAEVQFCAKQFSSMNDARAYLEKDNPSRALSIFVEINKSLLNNNNKILVGCGMSDIVGNAQNILQNSQILAGADKCGKDMYNMYKDELISLFKYDLEQANLVNSYASKVQILQQQSLEQLVKQKSMIEEAKKALAQPKLENDEALWAFLAEHLKDINNNLLDISKRYHNLFDQLTQLSNDWQLWLKNFYSIRDVLPALREQIDHKQVAVVQQTLDLNIYPIVEKQLSGARITPLTGQLSLNTAHLAWANKHWQTEESKAYEDIVSAIKQAAIAIGKNTCAQGMAIYNSSVPGICSSLAQLDWINSCQVINNIEKQVTLACTPDAQLLCGNGVVDDGEQCDDGNAISGDGCNKVCQKEQILYCGDGIISHPNSSGIDEQCENQPANKLSGDGCSTNCQNEAAPVCGDGILQRMIDQATTSTFASATSAYYEQCDDGNLLPGDGCNNLCQIEAGSAQRSINILQTKP
ncbi:MAG: DUF4215 domain-containing protein [Candidatus Komeilibacteria bacterium]